MPRTPDGSIRVFIVEDHALMRASLRQLVDMQPDMVVVGVAESAEEVMDGFGPDTHPDVAMIDLSLPGMSGDRLAKRFKVSHPELKSIIVTGHTADLYADAADRAGAVGFVMKDNPDEIVEAVRKAFGL